MGDVFPAESGFDVVVGESESGGGEPINVGSVHIDSSGATASRKSYADTGLPLTALLSKGGLLAVFSMSSDDFAISFLSSDRSEVTSSQRWPLVGFGIGCGWWAESEVACGVFMDGITYLLVSSPTDETPREPIAIWTPESGGSGDTLAIAPDGSIYLIGSAIRRVLRSGELDSTFGAEGEVDLEFDSTDLEILPSGGLLFSGPQESAPDVWGWHVSRIQPDGTVDHSFGTGGSYVRASDDEFHPRRIVRSASDRSFRVVGNRRDGIGVASFSEDGNLIEENTVECTRCTVRYAVELDDGALAVSGSQTIDGNWGLLTLLIP